jgi:polysaccharide biosynthesis/export protein
MKSSTTSLLLIMVLSSLVCLGGCVSLNPKDIEAFKKPNKAVVSMDKYILEPADQIILICPAIPEITNLPQQTIRPDGKVSFPNIGDVEVAGKTPLEASEIFKEKFSKLYTLVGDHPIDVRVALYQSCVYYVLGQVDRPGPRLISGRGTALRAVSEANPTVLAWTDRIRVVRPSRDPNAPPKIFELQWRRMASYGEIEKDVLLQEGDIIYVPPTVLASIAMKIEEFVRPLTRAFAGASAVSTPISPSTGGLSY